MRDQQLLFRQLASQKTKVLITILSLFAPVPCTGPRAEESCASAIAAAEQQHAALPPGLLGAISMVESGRPDSRTGRLTAWPWSVNAAGESHFFNTRQEAIDFVAAAQARGIRSIDVGCMQINLQQHPEAFASLEEAFMPEANVRYASAFLLDLRARTGNWTIATGYYHSATPGLSEAYAERVRAVLGGLLPDSLPQDQATHLPPIMSPLLTFGTVTRGVRIVVPDAAPNPVMFLRRANMLPRVYHP